MTSEDALRLLLELSVRATAVLGLAAVALWSLRRRTAALRHRILSLALGSLFVRPLVPAWLPAPAWLAPGIVPRSVATQSRSAGSPRSDGASTLAGSAVAGADPSPGSFASNERQAQLDLAFGLWIVVAALLLVREGAGRLGAARLTRSAAEIAAGELADEARELALRLRIRRRVRLCSTGRVASPATVVLLRPHIFLPRDAEQWPVGRRRVALLHELAHVSRRDDLVLLIGRTARACFWFHPLVWWAVRELRRLAEEACDDVVLREHGNPCGYAEELLGFAHRQSSAPPAVVCCMAGSSNLERRIASILDPARSREGLHHTSSIGTLFSTAIAVLAIGSLGRSETEQDRDALADWLASQHADDSAARAADGLDHRWRTALDSASGRCWIGYAVDVRLEEPTIFRRDVHVPDLPDLVHPTCSSLLVVVDVSGSHGEELRIQQVQASNAPRALGPRGAPFLWLGLARKAESLALLRELQASASGEARGFLLALLGLHAQEDLGGTAELLERAALESKDIPEAEGALTGLSFLPRGEAAVRIARVAERAQQRETRDRARETLEELDSGSKRDAR